MTKISEMEYSNILTVNEMCDLFDFAPYEEPDGTTYKITVRDMYEDDFQSRALYAYAYKKGYEFSPEMWEMTQECEQCDGSGFIEDQEMMDCSSCSGSGRVELDMDSIYQDELFQEMEGGVQDEHYKAWKKSVEHAFEKYLEYHNLKLVQTKIPRTYEQDGKQKRWFEDGYALKPVKSWKDVVDQIVETINGVGYFWFDDAKHLLESGPYRSYKQAAIHHLHWIQDYGKVYGSRSPDSIYQDYMEHYLYSW